MKNLLISIGIILLVASMAQAQEPSRQHRIHTIVAAGTSFADSGIDTTGTITSFLGGYNNVSFVARAQDSISITKVYIDRSPAGRGALSWSVYDSSGALSDVHNTASVVAFPLRGPAIDKLGGTGFAYRLRIVFAGSANGTTSATYGAYLHYNP